MQTFSGEIQHCDLRLYLLNHEAVRNHQDLISVSTKSILRLMMYVCSSTNLIPRYVFKNETVKGPQYFNTAERWLYCFSPLVQLVWPVYEILSGNTDHCYWRTGKCGRHEYTTDSQNYTSLSGGLIYADVKILGIKKSKNRARTLKNSDESVLFILFQMLWLRSAYWAWNLLSSFLIFFLFKYPCHSL